MCIVAFVLYFVQVLVDKRGLSSLTFKCSHNLCMHTQNSRFKPNDTTINTIYIYIYIFIAKINLHSLSQLVDVCMDE